MSAPVAGHIQLRLTLRDGAVARVGLVSSRPVGIGAVLAGRTPEEALALLPWLFTFGAMAHGAAARAALQAADGEAPSPAVAAARERRVLAEMLEDHARNALEAWPALLGEQPDRAALLALRRSAQRLRDAALPDRRTALTEAEAVLAQAVFGREGWPGCATQLPAWAERAGTPAARLLRAVLARGLAAFGATECPPVSPYAAAWCLAEDAGFAARPVQRGLPAEAGPALDPAGATLLRSVAARHGQGLLARLTARLAALHGLPRRLRALLGAEAAEPALHVPEGDGTGHAETARGPLLHWVRLEAGRVQDWRVLTPTEWNFHPDGPAARGLIGAADGPDLLARARWHLAALDPCVPCTVRVAGGQAPRTA